MLNIRYALIFFKKKFVFLKVRHFETTLWNKSCHCQGNDKQNNKLNKSKRNKRREVVFDKKKTGEQKHNVIQFIHYSLSVTNSLRSESYKQSNCK